MSALPAESISTQRGGSKVGSLLAGFSVSAVVGGIGKLYFLAGAEFLLIASSYSGSGLWGWRSFDAYMVGGETPFVKFTIEKTHAYRANFLYFLFKLFF